jgi:hypothetical protein
MQLLRNVCSVDDNACTECLDLDVDSALVHLISSVLHREELAINEALDLAIVMCVRPAAPPPPLPAFPTPAAGEAAAFRARLVRRGVLPPLLRIIQSIFDDLCPDKRMSGENNRESNQTIEE